MHHGLGEPLPHQLANAPRVHPSAEACASFPLQAMRLEDLCGFSIRFRMLSPSDGQVTHVLLTRPPLTSEVQALRRFARLACIRHAASVRPEPGSNSHEKIEFS